MTSELAVLTEARRLIQQKGWTKNTYAKDINGGFVQPGNPDAVCFCTLGALRSAAHVANRSPEDVREVSGMAAIVLASHIGRPAPLEHGLVDVGSFISMAEDDVVRFNDRNTTNKDDILKWFDVAIGYAQGMEAL